MASKQNRIVTSFFLDDPQNQKTCYPYVVPQNGNLSTPESLDIFYKLSESKPPCLQPDFGQLFYLRSSVEENQSLPIFSSGNSFISEQSSSVSESYGIQIGLPQKVQIMSPQKKKAILCNCSNSQCMKLYCQCFRAGKVCSKDTCGCSNCQNRTNSAILLSNLRKTEEKENRLGFTCKCKKNQCGTGYCDCFGNSQGCSAECQCIGCKNTFGTYVPQTPTTERKLRYRNT